MKLWPIFVLATILCWGAYVPTIHHGQMAFGRNSALRAFLFVCVAYFLMSLVALAVIVLAKSEPWEFTRSGITVSTIAGVLGALGALGIVFAMKYGGKPIFVAPVVFAGAPFVNTLVSMVWDKPSKAPAFPFYAGIVLLAAGAALVLIYKPAPGA